MCRRLVCLLVLLSYFPAFAEPPIPDQWKERLDLDRGYNVASRQHEIFSAEKQQVVPVYHVDLPLENGTVSLHKSAFLDEGTQKWGIVEKEGKTYARFFFVEASWNPEEKKTLENLKREGNAVEQQYWATKMMSHSTYFMWDPARADGEAIYLKTQWYDPSQKSTFNDAGNVDLAIENNDAVERALQGTNGKAVGYLPERFGASFKRTGYPYAYTYAYSLRTALPADKLEPGEVLWPLHGFLGSAEHLKEMALRRGISSEEWVKEEYLPKLARFIARSQFVDGLYWESHSQNLQVRLNRNTGEITGFVARDANDVLFDRYAWSAEARNEALSPKAKPVYSRLNIAFVADAESRAAGIHYWHFTGQSVRFVTGPQQHQNEAIFLRHLKAEAERITGHHFTLSSDSEATLARLESGKSVGHLSLESFLGIGFRGTYGDGAGQTARVAQEIADQVMTARMPQVQPAMLQYRQSTLSRIFWHQHKSQRAAYLFPDSIARLSGISTLWASPRYAYDGRGILAYDQSTGRTLAYASGLSDSQQEDINLAVSRSPSFSLCGWVANRLGIGAVPSTP